jgi:hypothetical protein
MPATTGTHILTMPLVAGSHSASTQPSSEGGAELGAPLTDSFMTDDDPTFREETLHVAEAEVKAKVKPYGMSNDLGRETVAPIRRPVSGVGIGHQTRLIADLCSS